MDDSEVAAVLSANLKRRRLAAGLTIAAVASAIGISDEQYEAIEAGDVDTIADDLTVCRLIRAAKLMGTTEEELARRPE